jgi:hypothetical protein
MTYFGKTKVTFHILATPPPYFRGLQQAYDVLLLVVGIVFFTILNTNLSFAQLFQPGAQEKLLLPNVHLNKKGASPNTVIDQNKAPTTTIITLFFDNNTCNNNNNRNHNAC